MSRLMMRTYIFFDLETTGLILGKRTPGITEISLVAVSRDAIMSTPKNKIPRVLHKLVIPVDPMKPIPLHVSQLTGLYNDMLTNERPFDQDLYEVLIRFIKRQPAPVCFVAHNGNKFDYPILLSELKRVGKELPDDIMSVDSITGFRSLLDYVGETKSEEIMAAKGKIDLETGKGDESWSLLTDDGFEEALVRTVDLFDSLASSMDQKNNPDRSCFRVLSPSSSKQGISDNVVEVDSRDIPIVTTPKHRGSFSAMQKVNETTPIHQMIDRRTKQTKRRPIVKKRLRFPETKIKNLKLATVYQYLVGTFPQEEHSAEADCLTILLCVIQMRELFIDWADANAVPLISHTL